MVPVCLDEVAQLVDLFSSFAVSIHVFKKPILDLSFFKNFTIEMRENQLLLTCLSNWSAVHTAAKTRLVTIGRGPLSLAMAIFFIVTDLKTKINEQIWKSFQAVVTKSYQEIGAFSWAELHELELKLV